MRTINQQLKHIVKNKKIGLMTHVVVGYPNLDATIRIVKDMEKAGVDFVELQIPFSDPLADGPTIMHANDVSLENGTTLADCFDVMKKLSTEVQIPLLFMGYYQSVFHIGADEFCKRASKSGAKGLIIPDMPIDEESHELFIGSCEKYGLNHIRLLSPTSTEERIKLNAKVQNGFVYCTSRSGITGANNELDPSVVSYLDTVKKHINVPIALGFGISKPEHILALVGRVDIAVVGSAVIDAINKKGLDAVSPFVKKLLSDT
jgi:tryptophan synthase alpha subunit